MGQKTSQAGIRQKKPNNRYCQGYWQITNDQPGHLLPNDRRTVRFSGTVYLYFQDKTGTVKYSVLDSDKRH